MFKKALSLLLALMLIVTSVSITAISVAAAEGDEEVAAAAYYVVGDSEELFTKAWGEGMIDANAMTANEDGTYTKVYEAVGPFEKAVSFKVTNGTDWIGTSDGKNVAIDVFAAGDITVKYDPKAKDDQVTVTGKGVKTVESTSPVETTVAEPATAELAATTTAAAATVAPVTEPAETAVAAVATEAPKAAAKAEDAQVGAPEGEKLVVTAKSNITPTYTQSFDPTTGQVTVTYWIQMTEKYMINAQWTMSYDKDYLTIDNTKGVNTDSKGKKNLIFRVTEGAGTIVNTEVESMPKGGIKANASDLDGYDLNDEGDRVPFVSVTFNPTGKTGNTEVVLDVEIMNVKNDDDPKEDFFIKNSEIVQKNLEYLPKGTPSAVYAGSFDPDYEAPEQPTTALPQQLRLPQQPKSPQQLRSPQQLLPQSTSLLTQNLTQTTSSPLLRPTTSPAFLRR